MAQKASRVAPQLLTTSNFIGPWYHAALLFSGLGSIVLLFGVLFSQQIREDLVRAATSPKKRGGHYVYISISFHEAEREFSILKDGVLLE